MHGVDESKLYPQSVLAEHRAVTQVGVGSCHFTADHGTMRSFSTAQHEYFGLYRHDTNASTMSCLRRRHNGLLDLTLYFGPYLDQHGMKITRKHIYNATTRFHSVCYYSDGFYLNS